MRKIIVMSEYNAYPLWERYDDGLDNFDAHDLQISSQLADRIEEWGDKFEATYVPSDPSSSAFSTREEQDEFTNEGLKLSKELAKELGGKFTVEYRPLYGDKVII